MRIAPPNYTQTPNDLFDYWLPLLGEVELKVLLVIFRQTFGWHREKTKISISYLQKMTGSNRTNVSSAVQSLHNKGVILKTVSGNNGTQITEYQLVIDDYSNNSYQYQGGTPPQYQGGTP